MKNKFENTVLNAFKACLPIPFRCRELYVGFSGGADSTALLLTLWANDVQCVAVHFDHGLRGEESTADVEWCRAFCEVRNIPFLCEKLRVAEKLNEDSAHLENTARELRLAAWARLAGEKHAVALGHHRDDQLENLLIRLGRGSNASGLCGLRKTAKINGVTFVRPLLSIRRVQIEKYLKENGVEHWREDSTNRDERFLRNAIRYRVLPTIRDTLGDRFELGMLASIDALEQDAKFLEESAENMLKRPMSVPLLVSTPAALLPRVLRGFVQKETGRDTVFRRSVTERVRAEILRTSQRPRRIPLGDALELILDGDQVRVVESGRESPDSVCWNWRKDPEIDLPELGCCLSTDILDSITEVELQRTGSDREYFMLDSLADELEVRGWRPGDRMTPFGHKTPRKVKDLLSAAGIPVEERPFHPVVCSQGEIIWLPGIRRAEFGRVGSGADTVVSLGLSIYPGPESVTN
jgi:tRNA(Ile)-lysidine synthase